MRPQAITHKWDGLETEDVEALLYDIFISSGLS
jgi:hypothetical protein